MEMYCFVPGVVNEVLQVMLLEYLAIMQVISAQGRCCRLLINFHLPLCELPLTTHH